MIISYRDLVDLITEGVRKQLNDKKELMQETVSMWIDPDTDAKIDDRAEAVNDIVSVPCKTIKPSCDL